MAAVTAAAAPPSARSLRTALARAAAVAGVALFVTIAGIGWLDLLRRTGALRAGPRIRDALPLEQLAGRDAQPLARVVAAWLPAGLVAGLALRAAGVRARATRAALAAVPCVALLLLAAAAADAVAETEPLRDHLAAQPHCAAPWIAAGLVAAGAALPRRPRA